MATSIFGGALYIDQFDFSAITKALSLQVDVDPVDMTVLSSTTRVHAAGLRSSTWATELLYDPTYEATLSTLIAASGSSQASILSYYPSGAAAQDETCYFGRVRPATMSRLGAIGDAAMMSLAGETADLASGAGAQTLAAGYLSCRGAAASATVSGASRNLGALANARQIMLMAAHVTSITGTASITFNLQSEDSVTPHGYTLRGSTSSLTSPGNTAGALWMTPLSGATPLTDDLWRVVGTITGTGTVTFRANMARIVLPS